jgi:uncharacterized protein
MADIQIIRVTTLWKRLIGLLGKSGLSSTVGWFFPACKSIHTFGMRFPIALVWLDTENRVVLVVPTVYPFRVASCAQASAVVEIAVDSRLLHGCEVGNVPPWLR